ncbi:MAG: ATP-dependent Clp protease adaptor ClpS [Spirochaetia bacterium]|jgi:ATP-dependent Clp protease adaptor protein ClpS|nr:ATP-dependent Clp protease adaptor ClpS [Spirochaetia bacterium]
MSGKTAFSTDNKTADMVKEPGKYIIVLHNDNYTTMEFVVSILKKIFHKSSIEANRIMLDVHKKGAGIVGSYTYDIAATKMYQVENMASRAGYPLKCTMEKE